MTNNFEKHFTASALILKDNKILLVHHKKLDVWLYPGGHVEKNETPDDAVIREVKEETGLSVEIISDIDHSIDDIENDVQSLHQPYIILSELVGDHYHIDMVYMCKMLDHSESLKIDTTESNDIRFFKYNELRNIKLFPNFRALLEKVFR